MPLSWAPHLARSQVIRRAGRLLALHRAVEASRPHDWNIQALATEFLTCAHAMGIGVGTENLFLLAETVHHYDIDSQTQTATTIQPLFVKVHVRGTKPRPCIHPIKIDAADKQEPEADLLDNPWFWTRPESHARLAHFLRLDGMACSGHIEGPWQHHDPLKVAPLRAALAALACERAYHEEMFLNNPGILTVGRMKRIGRTLDEVFIQPWRKKFETYLRATQEVEAQPGVKKTWRFLRDDEDHWSLELCWAIVKQSYRVRLDCPPLVLPLEVVRRRGDLSPIQAVLTFLVDDPRGPKMKAANAARHLGFDEHAVHEQLSQARKERTRPTRAPDQEPLWDPFPNRSGIMWPAAMRSSHSGMTSGEQGRDDTSTQPKGR